jgi:hypothetical protein
VCTYPGPREAHPGALVQYADWRSARHVDSTFAVHAGNPLLGTRPHVKVVVTNDYDVDTAFRDSLEEQLLCRPAVIKVHLEHLNR